MPPIFRKAALIAASAALTATPVVVVMSTTNAQAAQPEGYGPSDPFDDALMPDDGPVEPMNNQSKIIRTRYGYRLTSGQQSSRMTIKLTSRGLKFADTRTRAWKSLPRACRARNRNARGIVAFCRVPAGSSPSNPVLVEVHPRLGDDRVNARTLPATFQLAVLADAGADTVRTGAGDDFINGAFQSDRIFGGGGNDWIRGGSGDDHIRGGGGDDYIVGQEGDDDIRGGSGDNRIYHD